MFRQIPCFYWCFLCSLRDGVARESRGPPQETTGLTPDHEKLDKTLIHNAKIYTMDAGFSTADAILFDSSGRIHNVGGEQAMLEAFPDAMRIDLRGKTIIPGLIDSHAHLYGLAISLSQAQLREPAVKRKLSSDCVNRKSTCLRVTGCWDVVGTRTTGRIKEFPSRSDLDSAFPDRPVWLRRIDGHAGWANSAALAMADQDLSGDWQPQGGHIYRDVEGRPAVY